MIRRSPNGEYVVEFVSNLLKTHGIIKYRDLFDSKEYSKESIPKTCEALIRPFTLTPEEYQIPSGLYSIALSTSSKKIELIPKDKLLNALVLRNPRKTADYVPLTANLTDKAPILKGKGKRSSASVKGKKESISGINDANVKRKKRSRLESRLSVEEKDFMNNDEPSGLTFDESMPQLKPQLSSSSSMMTNQLPTPKNLNGVMKKVFELFWDENLDPVVAAPFFTLISRENCAALGMADYFTKVDEACTLTNIRERLENGKYLYLENFVYDFNLMFDNVCSYYNEDSIQVKTANELRGKFISRWIDMCNQLG